MEGEAEQAPLVERARTPDPERDESRRHVQEDRLRGGGELDRPDDPDLVGDVEPARLPRGGGADERRGHAGCDLLETDRVAARPDGSEDRVVEGRARRMRRHRSGEGERSKDGEQDVSHLSPLSLPARCYAAAGRADLAVDETRRVGPASSVWPGRL